MATWAPCILLTLTLAQTHAPDASEQDAIASHRKECQAGDGHACGALGALFQSGQGGLPQDEIKAIELYRKGCELADGESCRHLGWSYAHGEGTPHDESKAAELYRKGCETDPLACGNLAIMYEVGEGLPKDDAKAYLYFQKACDGPNGGANCTTLGWLVGKGIGAPADDSRAAGLFQKACQQGDPTGCFNLGVAYRLGRGVTRDAMQGNTLLKRACDGDAQLCRAPPVLEWLPRRDWQRER